MLSPPSHFPNHEGDSVIFRFETFTSVHWIEFYVWIGRIPIPALLPAFLTIPSGVDSEAVLRISEFERCLILFVFFSAVLAQVPLWESELSIAEGVVVDLVRVILAHLFDLHGWFQFLTRRCGIW